MSPKSDVPTIEHISAVQLELEAPVSSGDPENGWAFVKYVAKHPIIVLCCLYGNLGAAMYGFDNLALTLCLTMRPFL